MNPRFVGIMDDPPVLTPLEINRIRIEEDDRLAQKIGLSLPPPLFTVGTPVIQMGVDNFKLSRQEWSSMPPARDAAKSLSALIRAEERMDYTFHPSTLKAVDGEIELPDGNRFKMTKRGLRQLGHAVGPDGSHAGAYLSAVDPDVRDYALNRHFQNSTKKNPVKLRTFQNDEGERSIFATVGHNFPDYDSYKVLDSIANILPKDARTEITYDGDGGTLSFDVLYHSDLDPTKAAAGEIFKVGFRLRTADNGSSSYKVSLLAYRNLCLNFIVIGSATLDLVKLMHKGEVSRLEDLLTTNVALAVEKISVFGDKWNSARSEVVPFENEAQLREIYLNLLTSGKLKIKGNKEKIADNLMLAWNFEKGNTKADVVNAVTRMAHISGWSPSEWTDSVDAEEAAGELLYTKVQWNRYI